MLPLVAVLVVGGWLVWASRQDGGVSGVVDRAIDQVRQKVDDVTASGDAEAAGEWLNGRYVATGSYPHVSEQDYRELEVSFAGVTYVRCSDHHAVLQAFTARGTVSRLIVAGEDWGDADSAVACPTNLFDPTPWTAPPR